MEPAIVRKDDAQSGWRPWPHRLAVVTTAATFLLILVGGVVTNTGTGMAVPDWPTTFGYNMFLYPWSKMVGGVLYEHTHRLLGSFVGSLTLTLAVLLWAVEPRGLVRGLGIAALAAVVIQGVLGGLRVVLAAAGLAIVHGAFAHAFFALVAAIAVFTSRGWRAAAPLVRSAGTVRIGRLALWTTVGLYAQIVLGTLVTHRGARLDAHLVGAAVISVAVIVLGFRVMPGRADWPELAGPTEALRALWLLQLLLAAGAYVARFHAVEFPLGAALSLAFPVSHRLTGSAMLIASLVLTLRAYRRAGWFATETGCETLSPKALA
ncbi:MAG: putative Cytochrome oxidase assembly precursor [candidate division NC10 bacterium]|nr:putative Cytochrome oxidase assembly precursor [candidate division NC10 bacterium]